MSDKGVGTMPSMNGLWPIFYSQEADTPDDVISVFDGRGRTLGYDQIEQRSVEKPAVRIQVRSRFPEPGYRKASEIADFLDKIEHDLVQVSDVDGTNTTIYVVLEGVRNTRSQSMILSGMISSEGRTDQAKPGMTAAASQRYLHMLSALVCIRKL